MLNLGLRLRQGKHTYFPLDSIKGAVAAYSLDKLVAGQDKTIRVTNDLLQEKDIGFLGSSIDEGALLEFCEDVEYENLVVNGDFSDGTAGWIALNSTSSVENNILRNTGDGANRNVGGIREDKIYLKAGSNNRKYLRAELMILNDDCDDMSLYFSRDAGAPGGKFIHGDSFIINPIKDNWYTISIVQEAGDVHDDIWIYFRHRYQDASIATGKQFKIRNVFSVDMGNDDSNPLYNLTAEQMNELFPFVDGTGTVPISAYINTWYDQSGNGNHATQATLDSMPRIVHNGVIEREPITQEIAMRFNGINNFLQSQFGLTYQQPYTIVAKAKRVEGSNTGYVYDNTNDTVALIYEDNNDSNVNAGEMLNIHDDNTSLNVDIAVFDGVNSKVYKNGVLVATANAGSNSLNGIEIGRKNDNSSFLEGHISDIIIFDRALTESEIERLSNRL